MTPRFFHTLIFLALLRGVSCLKGAGETELWGQLTPRQQEQLTRGETVVVTENVPESAWPRYSIYSLVNASPEEVAAIFWNCELEQLYIPNCLSVRILDNPSPSVQLGEFTLKMPFLLPNEVYVSRMELHPSSADRAGISWKVLSSHYIRACEGELRIESYVAREGVRDGAKRRQKSLLRYTNLVTPSGRFASLLRSRAGIQVLESVKALIRQVDREVSGEPVLLASQIKALGTSLPTVPEKTQP